ncbi:hypothetical protein JNO12_14810 [Erwinia aphidicola]|nr:hypothetical protein [Erwinia aphidicola]
MKRKVIAVLILFAKSVYAAPISEGNENISIREAVRNGYQAQRNLAYYYSVGHGSKGDRDFIQKSKVNACAWRKILLIANPEKTDASDSSNERHDCGTLNFKQDEQVWGIVHKYLPEIQSSKNKGEYMLEKQQETPQDDEVVIIDVDN